MTLPRIPGPGTPSVIPQRVLQAEQRDPASLSSPAAGAAPEIPVSQHAPAADPEVGRQARTRMRALEQPLAAALAHNVPSRSEASAPAQTPAAAEAPAPSERVNRDHPHLRALATGRLVGAREGLCVTATLDNMQRNGVPQPAATGRDAGNNPRGAMVQMINNHGWKSLPGAGEPQTIKSPYGTVTANVISGAEYEKLARAGEIPSGAMVFQTRHASWNGTASGSSGYDMGIARDRGRTLFNYANMGGPMVYPDTRQVVVLVPGGAIK